jgi:predicted dehydrogenase
MAIDWKALHTTVVGTGSIGRRHIRVLRSLGVKNMSICEPVKRNREFCLSEGSVTKVFTDYKDVLNERPDAVIICTPTKYHIPMAIEALQHGIHVLCEKPLSNTLERVDELAKVIQESQKVFMVAFCFRYHEGLTKAKDFLTKGRIGPLLSIRCSMGENIALVMPDYKNLYYIQEGGAFELVHEIDLACWFAGMEATEVQSMYGAYSSLGFTAPDLVEINLRFGDKCVGNVHLDFFSIPRTRVTELKGEEGTIKIEFACWDECTVSVYNKLEQKWEIETIKTERDSMFRQEDTEFLQACVSKGKVRCPLSEAIKSQKILQACITT